jgi:DNA relaxase NicK
MDILSDLRNFDIDNDFDSRLASNMQGYVDKDFIQAVEAAALAVVSAPHLNNMGGTYPFPPSFSHDVKNNGIKNKVMMDYLVFSSCFSFDEIFFSLTQIWPDLIAKSSSVPMAGYPRVKALFIGTVQYGLIGFDAKKHNRICVSLTGVACKAIVHEDQFLFLFEVLTLLDARLSHIDLCLDFYRGEITFDDAFLAFTQGRFKNKNSPNNLPHQFIGGGDSKGNNTGRTIYIGDKQGENCTRIYEKGLEVFAKMPEQYRLQCTERENQMVLENGSVSSVADDWLRIEHVFRRKEKTRPIPLNIIVERDVFFAGVNPYFASILKLSTGKGRGVLKDKKEITHDKYIMAHRASYGSHIHTLREIGFTDTEICDLLDTGVPCQKLLKAGLIEIEKKAFNDASKLLDKDFDIPF